MSLDGIALHCAMPSILWSEALSKHVLVYNKQGRREMSLSLSLGAKSQSRIVYILSTYLASSGILQDMF